MQNAQPATGLIAGLAAAAAIGLGLAHAPRSAEAADLGGAPRPYAFEPGPRQPLAIERWTGFYLGATLGYGTGAIDVNGASGAFDLDTAGGVGQFFAGYNWQVGGAVLGIEGDIGAGWLDDQQTGAFGTVAADLNAVASLRARAGFLLTPAFLVYGTAGLAVADFDVTANGVGKSQTFLGYQAGVGTELMMSQNWTLRMEYIYTDLDEERLNYGGASHTYDPDYHTLRAGFSFKF